MIWYLLWLCWIQSHNPLALAALTVLVILTGTLLICLWFKRQAEKGEIEIISRPTFTRVMMGEDLLLDAPQGDFPFCGPYRVVLIKKLANNEGATIYCKRMKATRKPKEIPVPEEPKGDCPL